MNRDTFHIWDRAKCDGYLTDIYISTAGEMKYVKGILHRSKEVPIRIIGRHYFARIYVNGVRRYVSIARMVLETFTTIPQKYIDAGLGLSDLEADHINARKFDNSLNNLQWLTPAENKYKAFVNGEHPKCEDRPNAQFTNAQIEKVCKELERNKLTMAEISKKTGVSKDAIYNIHTKRSWTEISKHYNIDKYSIQPGRKFTQKTIHEICKLIAMTTLTHKEIAKRTGVSKSLVDNISGKHRWRSISDSYF